jgi:transcriptional regulator with XRE-family HTH domain
MRKLTDELKDKGFRQAYAATRVGQWIARRIKAIREAQSLSQKELGARMDKPQSTISRLEAPSYGRPSLQSLQEVASAFDVVLWVDFISYGEFLRRMSSQDRPWQPVPPFYDDPDWTATVVPPAFVDGRPEPGATYRGGRGCQS